MTLRDAGWAYEGRPGAFWVCLDDGVPSLRETAYDVEAAAAELRASGYPDAESVLAESLLDPVRRRGYGALRIGARSRWQNGDSDLP